MRTTLTLILITTIPLPTLASDLTPIGSYQELRATESNHCYGYNAELWQTNSKNIFGLLTHFNGSCADAACAVVVGQRSSSTLSFHTEKPIYGEQYSFEGGISSELISGKLNGSPVDLKLNSALEGGSLESWCSKWSKVSRCKGVAEYCGKAQ